MAGLVRKFGGRTYHFSSAKKFPTKREANAEAQRQRGKGRHVRVVKSGKSYVVYVRA